MKFDSEVIRQRHLRPEQMEHRTFYEGHIVIDLSYALEEIDRLQALLDARSDPAPEIKKQPE
jgi:hypothetical protein